MTRVTVHGIFRCTFFYPGGEGMRRIWGQNSKHGGRGRNSALLPSLPLLVLPRPKVAVWWEMRQENNNNRNKTPIIVHSSYIFLICHLFLFSQDTPLIWLVNGILASLNGNTLRLTGGSIRITGFTRDVGIITNMNASGFWI